MCFFDEIFLEIFKWFCKEMEKGFGVIIYFIVVVKMLFIFVRFILDGIEYGEFLVLDFGGINFCVFWVKVMDNGF